ncbi:type II toxin-antitoxin system Phd/YefM family antitoxin [soil metagenome]|jgi:prevent-host-death family protein
MDWKLADAKNRFSELVNKAIADGPQRVTRREDVVFVLSEADYLRLHGEQPDFIEYLLNGPDLSDLDLGRDRSPMREVDL